VIRWPSLGWLRHRGSGRAAEQPSVAEPVATGIPRDILEQVRRLELRTRGLVNSTFSGEYHSVFRGQGMEFAEVREYQEGDDVRYIDWNVTARTGTPYIKKHIEERELTVLLLVDLSGSEQFGTRSRFKAEAAAEIAAVLALSAARNNDRVGLVIFSDHVEHVVPAKKGKRHVLRLIRDVLAFQPLGRGTDIPGALDYAARLLSHRSVIFLMSDFAPPADADPNADMSPAWEKQFRLVSQRHDLIAVHINDATEASLPDVGIIVVRDPETGGEYVIDTGRRSLRERYQARISEENAAVQRLFRRLGIDQIHVRTDEPFVGPLLSFFRRRERKRGRR
jgi:uncharacterized protein (DUF58 family)